MKISPSDIHELKGLREFLAAIPIERWTVGTTQDRAGRRCAVGHVMFGSTGPSEPMQKRFQLQTLLTRAGTCEGSLMYANDGIYRLGNGGSKNRVIHFLNELLKTAGVAVEAGACDGAA